MRLREISPCLVLVIALGCSEKKSAEEVTVAQQADLTIRQLIAGLNAKNTSVLASLIVVTSTSGGAPRPLSTEEVQRLAYPDGPFEYEGPGKPGEMVLRDGKKESRVVRLIRSGEAMKVLATNESFNSYAVSELGASPNSLPVDTRVLTIMKRRN